MAHDDAMTSGEHDSPLSPRQASEAANVVFSRVAHIVAIASVEAAGHRLSKADLTQLLDACLELRQIWHRVSVSVSDSDPLTHTHVEMRARQIGQALVLGSCGWAERPEPYPDLAHLGWAGEGWKTASEREIWLWRLEVESRLRRAPSASPRAFVRAVMDTIAHLSNGSGELPPVLRPSSSEGHGQDPRQAHFIEEQLWEWIFFQKGTGRKIGSAIEEVAKAVHRSEEAVKKWRDAWRGRAKDAPPYEGMQDRLDQAEAEGKFAASDATQDRYRLAQMTALAEAWQRAKLPVKAADDR